MVYNSDMTIIHDYLKLYDYLVGLWREVNRKEPKDYPHIDELMVFVKDIVSKSEVTLEVMKRRALAKDIETIQHRYSFKESVEK
jgi:hypothetical protein